MAFSSVDYFCHQGSGSSPSQQSCPITHHGALQTSTLGPGDLTASSQQVWSARPLFPLIAKCLGYHFHRRRKARGTDSSNGTYDSLTSRVIARSTSAAALRIIASPTTSDAASVTCSASPNRALSHWRRSCAFTSDASFAKRDRFWRRKRGNDDRRERPRDQVSENFEIEPWKNQRVRIHEEEQL